MAPIRKFGGRIVQIDMPTANNTGATVLSNLYVYDPNPTGSYDASGETLVGISVTPLTAFSKNNDSFTLDMQQRDKLATTKGSAVTLWSGVATDGVAFVSFNANPVSPIALVQGDSLSFSWTKAGNGSASCPHTVITLVIGLQGA